MEKTSILTQTVQYLMEQKSILFPTDTVWGIGGDATSIEVVKKVYQLKEREESKALLCLVYNMEMIQNYFDDIPSEALPFFEATSPTTVILDNPKGIATNMIAADNSLAIRIPNDSFCQDLLRTFQRPIIATSANTSGKPTPTSFTEIEKAILEGVDYVVPLENKQQETKPSRIVKVNTSGEITLIRD